ncbi:ABC transporter ATP-binding protein [Pseudonocardia sp. KRD-184]|uniref:ABC transporter ATP-binding protein n=1 Tax=Pseudonocardia oceani TaxID=2792013 RepID=A0ABS6U3B3_9PSEU|nr:ATP-binding cassette domain-containing protein [Pseudonocardia oceani]MBW0092549.1 ABC transporter ATP-binding protein [Pseudonocardia oceani]MBW0096339.1 ABC transporter ATP-binding protein [Pseudonocardia oceani]MBW0109100.1 ABC transporter ATP-binding protein [Pseudonocardia oceani]MBW0122965.1 ABC transporter ATP-binding protein [Pseudonocardia oceani]MBW0126727.1 ABC transporter ATP-binding protein [Pseudonocardia oceani]
MSAPLVVEGLTVHYPDGHRALHGLDLRVGAHERWALVGRSGSGKTTLVRAVLGLLPSGSRATGSVRVGGTEVLGAPERVLRGLRGLVAGYVPQDPFAACDPLRAVGHHVAEAWTAHRRTPPAGAVVDGLTGVGIADAAARAVQRPHQWSGGMLQRATLLAATAHDPLLTLADEPTSALDADLADDVLALVRRRCGALLLISHDLALVARHADSVLVLDGGRAVERGPAADLLTAPAVAETRRLVAASAPVARRASPSAAAAGEPVARVEDVSRRYRHAGGEVVAVDGVTLAVRPGEVVGVVGRSGSGKSTLVRLLGGMEKPDSGTTVLGGTRPGYVMPVFQDPVASLDRRWTLWRTLTEPLSARGERHGRARRRALAAAALERVGLSGVDPDRLPGSLSVGQAQRVAVARALAADPALLVADEPTASLDVAAAAAVTDLLRGIADAGTAMLVVSHDERRLASYADRVVRMRDGRLVG